MPLITGRPLGTDPYCLVRLDGVAHDDCALMKCTRKPVVRPSVCKERRSVREVVAILMVNVMLSSRDGRINRSIDLASPGSDVEERERYGVRIKEVVASCLPQKTAITLLARAARFSPRLAQQNL